VRLAEHVQLAVERIEVGVDQVIAAGDEREVAIAAAVVTEGDVDVGSARSARV